jgi:hypothetical protein
VEAELIVPLLPPSAQAPGEPVMEVEDDEDIDVEVDMLELDEQDALAEPELPVHGFGVVVPPPMSL